MDFIKVKIEEVIHAKYNPRKNLKPSDEEYQKIKKSIEEFGYVDPIIVNKDLTIIGGHQRVKVLKDLGYEEIDCVQIDISKEKEKVLNVALNKISGSWDEELLKELLKSIDEDDLGLTGFDEKELEELLNELTDEEEEEEVEVEFTEELLEEHNYVVLYFDNEVDWLQAETLFDLKSVQSLDSKPGFKKIGIGRVIKGVDAIRKILGDRL